MGEAQPSPPFGTAQRIRNRSIWAVALFTASVLPALIGLGIADIATDQDNVALPLAATFWATGFLFALWAAVPTLRYWDDLPVYMRWMGALPLLTVSLFLSLTLITSLFV